MYTTHHHLVYIACYALLFVELLVCGALSCIPAYLNCFACKNKAESTNQCEKVQHLLNGIQCRMLGRIVVQSHPSCLCGPDKGPCIYDQRLPSLSPKHKRTCREGM